MIELARHIELLLLEHNCVVVPDLGGFIAQEIPARYIKEENIFLPPYRTVCFNPQLTLNDGLLAQSYMKIYGINYPEAMRIIEQAVETLKATIETEGNFELQNIGKLTYNITQHYDFTPNEAGILTPSLYGLDAAPAISCTEESTAKRSIEEQEYSTKAKNYTFRINKELVNYVAAVILSVFFYLIYAEPTTNAVVNAPQYASLPVIENKISYSRNPTQLRHIQQSDTTTSKNLETNNITFDQQTKQQKISDTDLSLYNYTIVLVSCIPLKNAEVFIKQVEEQGITNLRLYQRNKVIRVIYGQFSSEAEARQELRNLRKNHPEFNDAWIMNMQ